MQQPTAIDQTPPQLSRQQKIAPTSGTILSCNNLLKNSSRGTNAMQSYVGGRRAWKSESTAMSKVSRRSRHFNRDWNKNGRNGNLSGPKERRWLKKCKPWRMIGYIGSGTPQHC